ncbi:hypothetical protein [Fodinicurvata sediminis]|uniref:hypothetical protein n=1 Tax=Fodinicurvata sediminis TaxID=1121832 RepID=UPI0003B5B21C|nr:hypothetical protein [Fodinicurvata sediminis]
MVQYLSSHHSADDPGGLIGQALEMGETFPGPAEDLLLSWSLRLDDPATAARNLIAQHGLREQAAPEDPTQKLSAHQRLVALLHETARSGQTGTARRRGGRRARKTAAGA